MTKENEPGVQRDFPDLHTRECSTTLSSPGPFPCDCDALEQMRALIAPASREPGAQQPSGQDFDNDMGRLARDSRDATRYRWLRTNVNSGVTVLFDPKEGPDGQEGFDYNDEDCDAAVDKLMAATSVKSTAGEKP